MILDVGGILCSLGVVASGLFVGWLAWRSDHTYAPSAAALREEIRRENLRRLNRRLYRTNKDFTIQNRTEIE